MYKVVARFTCFLRTNSIHASANTRIAELKGVVCCCNLHLGFLLSELFTYQNLHLG